MDIKNISFIGNDERIKLNPSILKFRDMYVISYRISAINDQTIRYNFNLNNEDGIRLNDIYNSKPDIVKKPPFEFSEELPIRECVEIGKIGVVGKEAVEHTSDIYFNNFNYINDQAEEMRKVAHSLVIDNPESIDKPEPFISPKFEPVNIFQDDSCPVIPNKQIGEGFTRIILCDLDYNIIPGYKLDLFGMDARLFNDLDDTLNMDKFYVYSVFPSEENFNFIYEITLTDLGFIITNINRIPIGKFVKNIVFIKNFYIFTGLDLHTSNKFNFLIDFIPNNKYDYYMKLNDILLYLNISLNNYSHILNVFYSEIEKIKYENKKYEEDKFKRIYMDIDRYNIIDELIRFIKKVPLLRIKNNIDKHKGNDMFGSSAITCVKNIHTGINEYFALGHAKFFPTNVERHERLDGREITHEYTSDILRYLCSNINPQYKLCTSNIPLKGYANMIQEEKDKIFDLPENFHYYINQINSVKHFYDIITENINEKQKINSFFMYLRDKLFTNRHEAGPLMYYNFILKLDHEFNIIDITNPFIFTSCGATGINFACGLIIENNNFVIPFAVDDSISYIARIPMENIQFYGNSEHFDLFDMKFISNRGMFNIPQIIDNLAIDSHEKRVVKTIYNIFIEGKIKEIANKNSKELHFIAHYIYTLTMYIDLDNTPYSAYISPLKTMLKEYMKTLRPKMSILKEPAGYLQKYLKYKQKYLKLKSEIEH